MMPTLEAIADKLDQLLLASSTPAPQFLSVEAAAKWCSLSPRSIRNLLASGKLTPLRPCKGKILIDRAELESVVRASDVRPRRSRGRAGR